MQNATISELKNRLSAFLDKVKAGETVVVFDRDQPVARIERITGADAVADRLARLERSGLIRRARKRLSVSAIREASLPRSKQSVLQALIEERREGR